MENVSFEHTISANLVDDGKLLDLEDKNIGIEELRLLAASKELSRVEQLYLSQNQLCGEAIEMLCQVKCLTGLTSLYLNHNIIGDKEAKSIVEIREIIDFIKIHIERGICNI